MKSQRRAGTAAPVPRVNLNFGSYLIIESTEAMTHDRREHLRILSAHAISMKRFFRTNLEARHTIACESEGCATPRRHHHHRLHRYGAGKSQTLWSRVAGAWQSPRQKPIHCPSCTNITSMGLYRAHAPNVSRTQKQKPRQMPEPWGSRDDEVCGTSFVRYRKALQIVGNTESKSSAKLTEQDNATVYNIRNQNEGKTARPVSVLPPKTCSTA